MGAIGGLLGTAGGVSGTGISGPQGASIQQGVTTDQTGKAYDTAQGGLAAQQALLAALQQQGGLQNQTNVYNSMQGLGQQMAGANAVGNQSAAMSLQQALNQALSGSGGVNNQNNALLAQQQLASQQQATAQQYQNIASGIGPNPAQAALNQATGQNVANQAALMAGQRGAGANVGLMARQAGMQGANVQQQAVGQSALQQAQQQIAGLQGLSGQQQAIGATNQSVAGIAGQQLAAQQAGITSQAQQAAQQIAQQQAQQAAMATQANQQAAQQIAGTSTLNQAAQAEQGTLLGSLNAQNAGAVSSQGNVNSANAGLAGTQMQGQQAVVGGILQAAGPAMKAAALGAAEGGMITKMAVGGAVPQPAPVQGPMSSFGQFLSGWSAAPAPNSQSMDSGFVNMAPGHNPGADKLKDALSSMNTGKESTAKAEEVTGGGGATGKNPAAMAPVGLMSNGGLANSGGHVKAKHPSQKAVKSGNSYANDKIPALLSEGEIVIPRDVLQSGDPVGGAADFVARIMAKRGKK